MQRILLPLPFLALLTLAACSSSGPTASSAEEPDVALGSGSALIESPVVWEALEKGIANSPEIKYARKLSARIERDFESQVSQSATPKAPGKCYKLPPIDVVMDANGKVTKAANRAKSCWLNGTRTALKVIQGLEIGAPPAGLLKDGKFKFAWTPDIPLTKAE